MTNFWWAKALKKSHLEQARTHFHFCARYDVNRHDLEMGFGHMRAIVAVESAVEVPPGSIRALWYSNLERTTLEAVATMMEQYNKGTVDISDGGRAFLQTFDDWEDYNRQILNC